MGVGYTLVNHTKREQLAFTHIAALKMRELAGNPASAGLISWYMLNNIGDEISFAPDQYYTWPFPSVSVEEVCAYTDVTDRVVDELIAAEILRDHGRCYEDEDEPDTVFTRDLRNVWME